MRADNFKGTSWSEVDTETVRRMWQDGKTATQIAAVLSGRTRNSVIGKVHKLGLKRLGLHDRTIKVKRPPRPNSPVRAKDTTLGFLSPPKHLEKGVDIKHEIGESNVGFMDLEGQHCRAPLITCEGKQVWCGQPKYKGSFCAGHYARFYTPIKRRTKRMRDDSRANGEGWGG